MCSLVFRLVGLVALAVYSCLWNVPFVSFGHAGSILLVFGCSGGFDCDFLADDIAGFRLLNRFGPVVESFFGQAVE